MINLLTTHLLSVLQADRQLSAGGGSYPAGWQGVKRPSDGDTPSGGYVNLFDGSFEASGIGHAPGIYLGMSQMECMDRLEFSAIAGGIIEYRELTAPLVIVTMEKTKWGARAELDQLRSNVRQILFRHIVESGYWYELLTSSSGSGLGMEHEWVSSEGSGDQRISAAASVVPCLIRYVWNGAASP